jgi:hypothetical protein
MVIDSPTDSKLAIERDLRAGMVGNTTPASEIKLSASIEVRRGTLKLSPGQPSGLRYAASPNITAHVAIDPVTFVTLFKEKEPT